MRVQTDPDTAGPPPASRVRWYRDPVLAHAVPFLTWILLMFASRLAPASAWAYALQTVVVTVLLFVFRPWRWYPRPRAVNLLPAAGVGLLVLAVWVLPLRNAGEQMGFLRELYLRFAVLPLGRLPTVSSSSVYAPEICGWPLALVRLAGSAFVIAVAEEFFWRGFLYRWLQDRDFLRVPPGVFDTEAFCLCAALFALEHRELAAGLFAGIAYAWLLIRTRDIWAAVAAHVLTNLLLGIYVIVCGAYVFW
jgi:CAAX prenyl protease-like protein